MVDVGDGETDTHRQRDRTDVQGGRAEWLARSRPPRLAASNRTSWGGSTVLICCAPGTLDLIRRIM